jgi:hypothetical protein
VKLDRRLGGLHRHIRGACLRGMQRPSVGRGIKRRL